MLILVLEQ